MTPQQLTEGLDQTKPILVLDHEPDELSELAAAGADLDLSGHTHDGQLFPANLIVSMVWETPVVTWKRTECTASSPPV